MAKKTSIYSAVVLIVVAGLFAGGYLLINRRSQTECGFCQRHINPKAHVVAEVGGQTARCLLRALCGNGGTTGEEAAAADRSDRLSHGKDGEPGRGVVCRG